MERLKLWLGHKLKSQLLSKMVFREAICEGWKFNIAPAGRTGLQKPLAKLEFEWNKDGWLRAIHRFLSCSSCRIFFEPKRLSQAFCSVKCQKHHYYKHRDENFAAIRCAYCGNEFKPSRHGKNLCSESFQQKYWYRCTSSGNLRPMQIGRKGIRQKSLSGNINII
jgi:hypothetical protein